MQDFVGEQIDRYRITERLGMGGMAVVYKAFDTHLERDVAIKVIRTEAIPQEQHERLLKRFEREAKAQGRFSHPNIVPVYASGMVEDRPYLVMAYLNGGTLKEKIGTRHDYLTAGKWLLPIVDALAYAHDLGVIHRDVKPSNILFDGDGNPILADFGIAKIIENNEMTLTGTGLGVGTPEYMAPEQCLGDAVKASDQYAIGIILYELLTGVKPFTADTPIAVGLMQLTEAFHPVCEIVPEVPARIDKLLSFLLAPEVSRRYDSMWSLKKAFEDVLEGIDPEPPSQPENIDPPELATPVLESEAETVDGLELIRSEDEESHSIDQNGSVKPPEKGKKNKRKTGLWWYAGGAVFILLGLVTWRIVQNQFPFISAQIGGGDENYPVEPSFTSTFVQATNTPVPSRTPTIETTPIPSPTNTLEPVIAQTGLQFPINYIAEDSIKRYDPERGEILHIMDIVPGGKPFEIDRHEWIKAVWSENGRYLLYCPKSSVEFGSYGFYDQGLYIYDTKMEKEYVVSDKLAEYNPLSWSPNYKMALFASTMEGIPGLYLYNIDDMQYTLLDMLSSMRIQTPFWSSDSKFVYYDTSGRLYNLETGEVTISDWNEISSSGMEFINSSNLEFSYWSYERTVIMKNEDYRISYDYSRNCLELNKAPDWDETYPLCFNEEIEILRISRDGKFLLVGGYEKLYYLDFENITINYFALEPGFSHITEYWE